MRRDSTKPQSELAAFVRLLRRRVDPDARHLGPYVRLSSRHGKRVTQEELAEAIGVSREWYAVLESAAPTRTSTGLLGRLADALMVSTSERARLFQLAVPELRRAQLRDDSLAVLDAFSRLRALSKRLWAATSVEDALTTASEHITEWFDNASLVHTSRRREAGLWEARALDDRQDRNEASRVINELQTEVLPTADAVDAMYLYPRLRNAGDVGTPELYPAAVLREVLDLYVRRRITGYTFVKARVGSSTGLIANICVAHPFGHAYSASDRAILGACAELASVALS